MDERFTQFVEDVTGGLAADRELRLDVQHELADHLERTAEAFREEGMDDAASTAQALKVFGAPVEIAGELLEANKRRMHWRATGAHSFGHDVGAYCSGTTRGDSHHVSKRSQREIGLIPVRSNSVKTLAFLPALQARNVHAKGSVIRQPFMNSAVIQMLILIPSA